MPGLAAAVKSGKELEGEVTEIARSLGLDARSQFKLGRRIWGAERFIDVVLTHPTTRARLGLECKFQGVAGSAEEKIPVILQDIAAWPIPGLVVFAGEGFSRHMEAFLLASGKATAIADLEPWLRLYFGLDLA
jgi:hypothetical protein